MTHIINGMAGNIESHSTLSSGESILNITAILDQEHYGFSKLTVLNCSALKWQFVRGDDGSIGDELTLLKQGNPPCGNSGSSTTSASSSIATNTATSSVASSASTNINSITVTTEVVTAYTTYCPSATTFTQGSQTYTVTSVSVLSKAGSARKTNWRI